MGQDLKKKRRISKRDVSSVSKETLVDKEIEKKVNKNENVVKVFLNKYFEFYKKTLMRKHIVIYIICLAIFFASIAFFISKLNSTPNISELLENAKKIAETQKGLGSLLFEKIMLILLIIFAGSVPYFFIPVIGIGVPYSLAVNIYSNFNVLTGKGSIIPMCIGSIIELFAVGLAIATGIEYCLLATKKWKYSRNKEYSMLDLKKTFFEATKNKKKLKATIDKKNAKAEKNEKNNVKIPYMYFAVSFAISTLIILFGTIIAKV